MIDRRKHNLAKYSNNNYKLQTFSGEFIGHAVVFRFYCLLPNYMFIFINHILI